MSREENMTPRSVGDLEKGLLALFPAEDACEWDRTGLQVGNPSNVITKVAVALDPTVPAIREAHERGCNVLVTHHPPYLSAPDAFLLADSVAIANGAGVFEAIRDDVALLCFHTALDFNPRGYKKIPELVGLEPVGLLQKIPGISGENGYGCVCKPVGDDKIRLEDLARMCKEAFKSPVQVWGELGREVALIASGQGSASSLAQDCVEQGIDCLICGEIKYHTALDLLQAGVNVIALGHDVSEHPFVKVLMDAISSLGFPDAGIECIRQRNWTVC